MEDALGDDGTTVVCALRTETYDGSGAEHYGRRGHIAGSLNVPHTAIVDPDSGRFRPVDTIHDAFRSSGAMDASRIVTYCGGGIAATVDAFALHLLGHRDVSVYDGSLLEWSLDPHSPMRTGPDP